MNIEELKKHQKEYMSHLSVVAFRLGLRGASTIAEAKYRECLYENTIARPLPNMRVSPTELPVPLNGAIELFDELAVEACVLERQWREDNKGKFQEFNNMNDAQAAIGVDYLRRTVEMAKEKGWNLVAKELTTLADGLGGVSLVDVRGLDVPNHHYNHITSEFKIRNLTDDEILIQLKDQESMLVQFL